VLNQHTLTETPKPDVIARQIRHLRDHHPDVHEKVLAGALSVTAAAVEVGNYPRRIAITHEAVV
jgi:hypothetical protein